MIAQFGDPAAEHRALCESAGLVPLPAAGVLRIEGADRVGFLHNLLSQDIKRLGDGQSAPAALLTSSAKVLSLPIVLAGTARHHLVLDLPDLARARETLERYVIMEDVRLTDESSRWIRVAVVGPAAAEILREPHRDATTLANPLGGAGAQLLLPVDRAMDAWRSLQRAGARPAGWEAANQFRIEHGTPWYGVDVDDACLLPETGLETDTVSWTKGCYVGQEIVARMDSQGSPSRRLMRLLARGARPPAGAILSHDGVEAGRITSSQPVPSLGDPVALGYVKRPWYAEGTRLQADTGQGSIDVEVIARAPAGA